MKMENFLGISGAALAVALLVTEPAQAQSSVSASAEPAHADTAIADIIVTAERRQSTTQKAPLTIQVLTAEDIQKAGVSDVAGLQRVTSGVQVGQNGGSTQVFIRGVGSFAATPMTVPGVAFNVDGVYVGRPEGTGGNFYDLARVEVVKGPQGTLYGRNATGGAINLITNEPRLGATTLDLSLAGGNYNFVHASGAINLPLGEDAAVRGAFNIVHRDGFLSDGSNDDIQQSARVRLKWQPSDTVSLLLNADYSHLGGKGFDYVYLPRRPGSDPYEAPTSDAANAYKRSLPGGAAVDDIKPDNTQNIELYNFSGQLDWELPFATLTVIPAYRHVSANYITHFGARLEVHSIYEQKTLEVRLGNSSSILNWVIGGYYYNDKTPRGDSFARSNAFLNQFNVSQPKTEAGAVFGQATITVADGLRLVGGLRYTSENKKFTGSSLNRTTGALRTFVGERTFNKVTYRVGAEYDFSPSNMFYATYSTGDKSGGFSASSSPNEYDPEELQAFEAGFKNRFLNGLLQLNLSGFHWKYKEIQDSRPAVDSSGALGFATFNSGDATMYGGTLDLVAKPTSADTLALSAEYNHSKYDSFAYLTPAPFFRPGAHGCPSSGPFLPGQALPYPVRGSSVNPYPLPAFTTNCAGFQVARVPKWSGTASYAHEFGLSSGATVTLDGSVTYASARWLTIDFIQAERDNAYTIVNANLTYTSPDKGLSIGLFGQNLTKSVYYSGAVQNASITGLVAANIGAPRTYGVRANFKFGQ